MARIRTIKPEFFTSADVCALSPLARLLYIATWCEADREGRLVWNLRTLKIRYFPEDDCDMRALATELLALNLLRVYEVEGRVYAAIPTFHDHQHINPREAQSKLPAPPEIDASARVTDASFTREHASVTRREEGKGREGKGKEDPPVVPQGGPPPLFPVPAFAATEDASGPMEQLAQLQAGKAIREAAKRAKPKGPSPDALRVLERMAELVGCRYESSPALEARLREGVPVEDLLAVVEHLARDPWWAEKRYGNAEAPFRRDKFPSYLAQAKAGGSGPAPRRASPNAIPMAWAETPEGAEETRRCFGCGEYARHTRREGEWVPDPHGCPDGRGEEGAA